MGAKAITALLAIGINLALVLTMLRLIEPSAHPQLGTRVTTEVQLVSLAAFQESEPPPEPIEEPVSPTPEPPTPARGFYAAGAASAGTQPHPSTGRQ